MTGGRLGPPHIFPQVFAEGVWDDIGDPFDFRSTSPFPLCYGKEITAGMGGGTTPNKLQGQN